MSAQSQSVSDGGDDNYNFEFFMLFAYSSEIIDAWVKTHLNVFGHAPLPVFDGKKSLYTRDYLKNISRERSEFEVAIQGDSQMERKFKVGIKFVTTVRFDVCNRAFCERCLPLAGFARASSSSARRSHSHGAARVGTSDGRHFAPFAVNKIYASRTLVLLAARRPARALWWRA